MEGNDPARVGGQHSLQKLNERSYLSDFFGLHSFLNTEFNEMHTGYDADTRSVPYRKKCKN